MNDGLITRDKRFDYWNYLTQEKSVARPRTVTNLRLMQIKQSVIADDNFWFQVIGRFGGEKFSAKVFYGMTAPGVDQSRSAFWSLIRERIQIARGVRK